MADQSKSGVQGKDQEEPALAVCLNPIPSQFKPSAVAGEGPSSILLSLSQIPPQYKPKSLRKRAPLVQRP